VQKLENELESDKTVIDSATSDTSGLRGHEGRALKGKLAVNWKLAV
jgi:hypothetical protein